jgi:hypothetical protein
MPSARRGALYGAVALITLACTSMTATATATAAGTRTCNPLHLNSRTVTICVEFKNGEPYAVAGYQTASSAEPTNFWAGLYRCNNSTGPDCVLISASRDRHQTRGYPDPYTWQIVTSSKPYSGGHTYKACTTVTDVVNFCTRETT